MIQPVNRVKVREQIYDQMLNNIITGVWPKESKIPSENELAKMFNTSRVPIRETIQKLSAMGMLNIEQGKGTYVSQLEPSKLVDAITPFIDIDLNQIIEVLEYRSYIEPRSAYKAAKYGIKENIELIGQYLKEYDKINNPRQEFLELDYNFHNSILFAAGNTIILGINGSIGRLMKKFMGYSVASMDLKLAEDFHEKIYNSIIENNGEMAANYMAIHLESVIKSFKTLQT